MSYMPDVPLKYESVRTQALHCPACFKFFISDDMKILAMSDDKNINKLISQSHKSWAKYCPDQANKNKKFSSASNHKPLGTWAGTLTMSSNDDTNEEEMVVAINKIFRQKTTPVEKYAWYLEYTSNGLPHIHFIYRTPNGGRILAKVFKRSWKYWDEEDRYPVGTGFRGGYHTICHSDEDYLKYISKDAGRHNSNWTTP